MDGLQKTITQMVDSIGRPQLIRYVMIYMLVVGVISLCGGVLLFLGGALAGLGGAASAVALSQSGASGTEAAQATGALVAASGLLLIYGLLSIVTGPAMIVVGLGLRSRARWSRMGAVIIGGLSVLSSLIGLFTSGGILSLVWIIADALVIYVFYTDAGIKAEFEK
jgi:hypothetical protein